MSALEFVEPPKTTKGGIKHMTPEVRSALDARPGEWALLLRATPKGPRAAVYSYVKRHPEYEATSRTVDNDEVGPATFDVYVRRAMA